MDLQKEVDGWQLPFLVSASLPFVCENVFFLDQVVKDGVSFEKDPFDPTVHLSFIQFQIRGLVRELPFRLEGVVPLAEEYGFSSLIRLGKVGVWMFQKVGAGALLEVQSLAVSGNFNFPHPVHASEQTLP